MAAEATAAETKAPVVDPWLDDRFAQPDFRPDGESLVDSLTDIANETPAPPAEPAAAAPAETVTPPVTIEPTVIETADGSTVTIERSKKGWKATLQSPDGATPEVFYGATKDELLQNVAVAKTHATKKIRELTRREKLGIGQEPPVARESPAAPSLRSLTADEIFEIKTALASDPSKAFDLYFQRRTGLTVEQLVGLAQEGRAARLELEAEATARAFVDAHSDYLANATNHQSILAFLAKTFLRRSLTDANSDEIMSALVHGGHWTVQNLTRAYDELSQDGLLEVAPSEPAENEIEQPATQAPTMAPVAAAPATPEDARIVRTVRRPRAGLGLRSAETIPVRAAAPDKPPSAEELENLTDDEVNALWAATRRAKLQTQR